MDTKSWTRSPKSDKDRHEVVDAKSEKQIKMDTKSWARSPKSRYVEATTSVREWRGAPKSGAWHWVVALLGWCSGRRGLHCRRGGCALLEARFAPRVVVRLICQKPTLLLDRLFVTVAGNCGIFACEAVARCRLGGCSFARDRRLAMRDSSSESAYRVFALAMRKRSHFRMPQYEASKAPVGHARAYRDILNDALAALSIIRRARRRRTLLIKKSNSVSFALASITCEFPPKEPYARSCSPLGKSEIDSAESLSRHVQSSRITKSCRERYSTDANTFPNTTDAGYTTSNTRRDICSAFRHPYHTSPSSDGTATFNLVDSTHFTVLEGMVNQLATNMATNMTELMTMLRDQNPASSIFTPPLKHRPIVDPNPVVPPIYVTDSEDVSFSAITYVPAVHSISDPLPPPLAPTAVSLPPAAFLSTDSTMHALPPLAMPGHPSIYTVLPPTVPPDNLIGSALDWFMTLKANDIHTWTDLSHKFLDQYQFCAETPPTLLDLSMIEMRESRTFEAYAMEWRGKAAKHIPLITERQQVQLFHSMLRGAYYSHLLAHTSSFSNLIEAGKKLDVGVKLGRIEGPSRKKDGEASKRLLRLMHIPCIIHSSIQRNRLISWSRQQLFSRNVHNSMLPLRFSKNQNLHCEFHQGAPGHTLDNCWRLRDRIQEMIHAKQISFNEVKPSNEMSAMGIMRSGRVYQGPEPGDKGKAPAVAFSAILEAAPLPEKKVTDQEAETFMKVIKASEYKVVEQIGKSPAHISLLALLLSSEPHRDALLKVLIAPQIPKETTTDRIKETVNSIFSNQISFAEDELPSEGQGHLRALHIICKCNNHVIGRVMINNGSALNICPISTLKQMNVDMSRIRASKITVRAFDGSRREVNGEIDLLIDVGPCSFSVTFKILEIPNGFTSCLGGHGFTLPTSFLHRCIRN
ncbi:hypothetical protein CRG98_004418 [Punica granatum]|uniref:Retrotransposon gag domain-containing protein n=1 Tax=Punica granatum TaxID=22663 RepID=A0A2I0L3D4_PUNGR|nr:hypothetical protein CRG98_004418 [Punica granatum]